jgi:hypothetical protein
MNLRKLAQGRECQIRLWGICNGNPETVVLAHFRLAGVSGIGMKSPDLIGSWACSDCHSHCDTNKNVETQLAFAHGVFRTQAILLKEGHIK